MKESTAHDVTCHCSFELYPFAHFWVPNAYIRKCHLFSLKGLSRTLSSRTLASKHNKTTFGFKSMRVLKNICAQQRDASPAG